MGVESQQRVMEAKRGCGNHVGLESPGPAASHSGAREVRDESEEWGKPHMFLMTQTLFPAPETNRRKIHIWDPPPADRSLRLRAPSPVWAL